MSESAITTVPVEPGELFKPLRAELGVSSFGINLLTLAPRQRLRVHLHQHQEEVYLVLEGELTLIVEGEPHILTPGTISRVAPEAKRQLTNPGTEQVVLIALGGAGEHQSRDALAWSSWEDEGEGRSPRDVPLPDDLPAA